MRGDKIKTKILSVQIIPNADKALLKALGAPEGIHSLGIITTDCDDVSYAALDEATKKAQCLVVYARSMYAGSGNASTAYAGEFIGILGSPDPAEVKSGVSAAVSYIENDAAFISANDDDSVVYFAQCISRPPSEAVCGMDAALKAADVELKVTYAPPSETNFAGGLLTGDQAACKAACEAFGERICSLCDKPIDY